MSQESENQTRRGHHQRRQPLKVELNVVVRTGEEAEDEVTIVDHRNVPMVGNVFAHRDRIMRFSVGMIWRVIAKSPAAYREVVPSLFQYLSALKRSDSR